MEIPENLQVEHKDAEDAEEEDPIFRTVKWKNVIRQNISRPEETMMNVGMTPDCWKKTVSN